MVKHLLLYTDRFLWDFYCRCGNCRYRDQKMLLWGLSGRLSLQTYTWSVVNSKRISLGYCYRFSINWLRTLNSAIWTSCRASRCALRDIFIYSCLPQLRCLFGSQQPLQLLPWHGLSAHQASIAVASYALHSYSSYLRLWRFSTEIPLCGLKNQGY